MPNNLFVEEANIVSAIVPVDLTTGLNAGDWVSLKNYERVTVVLFKAAGTANDDPVFTMRQATDVSGANAKALNFTRIDVKQGVQTAISTFTTVTQVAANVYSDLTGAENQALYVVEFRNDELDVNGGFDCVQLQIPDVGAASQLGCAFYILRPSRYVAGGTLSAIID